MGRSRARCISALRGSWRRASGRGTWSRSSAPTSWHGPPGSTPFWRPARWRCRSTPCAPPRRSPGSSTTPTHGSSSRRTQRGTRRCRRRACRTIKTSSPSTRRAKKARSTRSRSRPAACRVSTRTRRAPRRALRTRAAPRGCPSGGPVVPCPLFDSERSLTPTEKSRVTRLPLVPPVVFALAAYPSLETRDLSSVRVAVSGGAPLDAAVALELGRRVGFRVIQGYGMTEASPGTHYVPSDDRGAKVPAGSVGFLVPGTEARLVDPGTGVENEREGELWLRGPQITPGYLGAPEAAASALV